MNCLVEPEVKKISEGTVTQQVRYVGAVCLIACPPPMHKNEFTHAKCPNSLNSVHEGTFSRHLTNNMLVLKENQCVCAAYKQTAVSCVP